MSGRLEQGQDGGRRKKTGTRGKDQLVGRHPHCRGLRRRLRTARRTPLTKLKNETWPGTCGPWPARRARGSWGRGLRARALTLTKNSPKPPPQSLKKVQTLLLNGLSHAFSLSDRHPADEGINGIKNQALLEMLLSEYS